jgi:hypothetical protein
MLDVEARASTGFAGGRPDGSARAAWAAERKPFLVAGAFAFAVLLGVLIGLLTAPDSSDGQTSSRQAAPASPVLRPRMQAPTWDHTQPGRAHQVRVSLEPDPAALRLALRASLADHLSARPAGRAVTAGELSIPDNVLFYGAIEGTSAAADAYWVVGPVVVAGAQTGPHVWRRAGEGPWTVAASGPGACAQLPAPLIDVWRGTPAVCTGR